MANRISSEPVEVIISPTSQKARTSSVPVEVLILPTSQKARTSSVVVEYIINTSLIPAVGRSHAFVIE